MDCKLIALDMDDTLLTSEKVVSELAMENAQPGVKEVADFVTADNNHSGVALAIKKFAL